MINSDYIMWKVLMAQWRCWGVVLSTCVWGLDVVIPVGKGLDQALIKPWSRALIKIYVFFIMSVCGWHRAHVLVAWLGLPFGDRPFCDTFLLLLSHVCSNVHYNFNIHGVQHVRLRGAVEMAPNISCKLEAGSSLRHWFKSRVSQ